MNHSQDELDELWLKLKRQPVSDYATERITDDSDLFQAMQLDVLESSGSLAGTGRTVPYRRRRENPDAIWGPWEEAYGARAPF